MHLEIDYKTIYTQSVVVSKVVVVGLGRLLGVGGLVRLLVGLGVVVVVVSHYRQFAHRCRVRWPYANLLAQAKLGSRCAGHFNGHPISTLQELCTVPRIN